MCPDSSFHVTHFHNDTMTSAYIVVALVLIIGLAVFGFLAYVTMKE